VVVLAAGQGTRMRSPMPKVLHPLLGRSMLGHVLAAVDPLTPRQTAVVVGHGRQAVTEHLSTVAPAARSVVQAEQRGTGHAVRLALAALPEVTSGTVVVLCGDTPLLTTSTLQQLLEHHAKSGAAATLVTADLADPTGYGRIVRDAEGVSGIVEQADADERVRAVTEVNSGLYAFDAEVLRAVLVDITAANSKSEQYLTDVVALLRASKQPVGAMAVTDAREVLGVNDQQQLADIRALMRDRVVGAWMRQGVTVVDPASTWVDVQVTLAAGAVLHPGTELRGACVVGPSAEVGPGCLLQDTQVGAGATVVFTTADRAEIGELARVGPYTYLRPGTVLGPESKAGGFVEVKASRLGRGAKVPHLSYVGDADIGEGSNIGAATVFVNYDGVAKHQTVVGPFARIGSDTMLVAPVRIGAGAYTAAGSVITEDVPPGAMAVARSRQRTIAGWVDRRRAGSASARAARAALAGAGGADSVGTDEQAPDTAEGGHSR
jgi:bifunctional UDP-N-acetylglucosamine pyrophosphorylase/glucosamine-1-phosphate N-acetyltransferase